MSEDIFFTRSWDWSNRRLNLKMLSGVGGINGYAANIINTSGSSLLAYWPLWDRTGTVAVDVSGNAHNGAYAGGFTLGQAGIGDGNAAVLLDGINGRVNVQSTALANAFNGEEFTIHAWVQCTSAVWGDGTEDEIFKISASSDAITIRKATSASTLSFIYVAGGVTKSVSSTIAPDGNFHCIDLTVSLTNDQMISYFDGSPLGTTQTGLGTWSGTPTVMVWGSQNAAGATPWNGDMAHAFIASRALTGQEVLSLSSPFDVGVGSGFLALGDSKVYGTADDNPPADGSNGWVYILTQTSSLLEKPARIGKAGWTVALFAASIAADVKSAGGWVPSKIFVALGANDIQPLADPLVESAWEADLGTILDTMHTRWPLAPIYVDRVWRRYNNGQMTALNDTWIPTVLSTRNTWAFVGVDERLILPSTDDGVTYTSDGIHPNHAGHLLVASAHAIL